MPGACLRIEASDHAREFIAEHGGSLYVWADEDGFDHAKTEAPDGIEFVEHEADGFHFFQDPRIGEPDWWRVEFHHLPRPHVTATWDGGSYGGPALF